MPAFRNWLARVLADGESTQEAPPALAAEERTGVIEDLRAAYDRHALDVAGPAIPFQPDVAVRAAVVLARACWQLVSEAGNVPALDAGPEPASASDHLSADVTLLFLPDVYRRARLREPDGALAKALEALLRRWPLSGVLADLDGSPAVAPEFGGHAGLQLLYAERLLRTGRAGWFPADGPAREWAERVYQERGRPLPAPAVQEQTGD